MSLKTRLRLLAVAVAVAGLVLVIPSYFGTADDACAGNGNCPHSCPHMTCVTPGCGDNGEMPTTACTYVAYQGPHDINCTVGCRNIACQ